MIPMKPVQNRSLIIAVIVFAALLLTASCSWVSPGTQHEAEPAAGDPDDPVQEMILVTTTSTYDSGLLDVLLPVFAEQTGITVKPIAVGTGAALAMADRGEADAVLVHAPAAERELVQNGTLINRRLVMHNDFVIVGPSEDPAKVATASAAAEALDLIRNAEALFISRGDDSGTHKKELALWAELGVEPSGTWYQETGEGMGATLSVASEKQGYTLTDRGTYLALKPNLELEVSFEGDPVLLNLYHVAQVNPEKFAGIRAEAAEQFVAFFLDEHTQEIIGEFGTDKYAEPLFTPDGGKSTEDLLGGS
jgi:tungstate transport system substrate-binding protein